MAFKKNFKSINYIQLLFELIIVFIGVYLAFLFSNYQDQQRQFKEGQRVIALLKVGLDRYEELFDGFAGYHERQNAAIRAALQNNEIPNFGRNYYPAPQYPMDVIDFILTKESFAVFPVDVYIPLTQYSNAIQRMMYIEEKIVEVSELYRPLPPPGNTTYEAVFRDQYTLAGRYLDYMERRKNVANELVSISKELSAILKNSSN